MTVLLLIPYTKNKALITIRNVTNKKQRKNCNLLNFRFSYAKLSVFGLNNSELKLHIYANKSRLIRVMRFLWMDLCIKTNQFKLLHMKASAVFIVYFLPQKLLMECLFFFFCFSKIFYYFCSN